MEKLMVARNSLLVLLLALPSLHGSAGVWQFPAYGPSPRPLEAPTPRVARAAIPKDLVSGIANQLSHLQIKEFDPWLGGNWLHLGISHLQNIPVAESVFILCDIYVQKRHNYLLHSYFLCLS